MCETRPESVRVEQARAGIASPKATVSRSETRQAICRMGMRVLGRCRHACMRQSTARGLPKRAATPGDDRNPRSRAHVGDIGDVEQVVAEFEYGRGVQRPGRMRVGYPDRAADDAGVECPAGGRPRL